MACRSGTGSDTVISHSLVDSGWTTVTSRERPDPVRKAATSSTGSTVAERPILCAGVSSIASRRARDRARCTPRLVPATACTSSRITVSTPRRISRACEVSRRNSDSGVVMRMSGGWVASRRRSAGGVSPVRTPTLIGARLSPSRSAVRAVPTSGEVRLRSTSTPRALSGEMYRTLTAPRSLPAARLPSERAADRPVGRSAGGSFAASRSIAVRKAARVLPDPVGATTRVSSPRSMAFQAPACAGVGASKDSANHVAVAGEKDDGRSRRGATIAPLWTAAPTVGLFGPGSAPTGSSPCQLPSHRGRMEARRDTRLLVPRITRRRDDPHGGVHAS